MTGGKSRRYLERRGTRDGQRQGAGERRIFELGG